MARQTKQQIADQLAAETKAAQQAELKRMRAAKAAATRAKNKATLAQLEEQAKPAFDPVVEDAQREAKIHAAWDTLMGGFGIEIPSWKRTICALVIGAATAFGSGYLIGMVTSALMIGVFALTNMVWISYVIMALGMIIAALVGGKIGVIAANYIAEAKIDKHYESAKNTVTGWFKRKPVVQFSGAHAV